MKPDGLIAFPVTPMSADGVVDTAALRRLVRRALDAGVDAVAPLGSTGSYAYLGREQRLRALDAAVAEVDGAAPVLAGVGALRTDEAIACARDAKAAGAAVGLLAAVSYIPPTDDEVVAHFTAVAQESGLPICLYDNPAATHVTMGPELLARLGRIPGVVALKTAAPAATQVADRLSALQGALPETVSIGFSVDVNATEGLIAGGEAWYSVLAGTWAAPCVAIRRAVAAGDAEEARAIHARLQPLWDLFIRHTSLRVVYAIADRLSLAPGDPPRPLLPLAAKARREVDSVVDGLIVSWR